jgi:hypothetical protein
MQGDCKSKMKLKTLNEMAECNILYQKCYPPIMNIEKLEDSEIIKIFNENRLGYKKGYFKGDLKEEAIKWIKELEPRIIDEFSNLYFYDNAPAIIAWIKHFFNIEEEDLK